nr:MAG TPA: hypothetical protein [Caudoviricetes sp.]
MAPIYTTITPTQPLPTSANFLTNLHKILEKI